MKNLSFILLLFLSVHICNGQQLVKEISLSETFFKAHKNVFTVPIDSKESLLLLFKEKDSITTQLLSSDYQITFSNKQEGLPSSYKNLLGYTGKDQIYNVLFSNNKHNKIGALTYNFETNSVSHNFLKLEFKNEKFISSVSHNHKLYIITNVVHSSYVKLYIIDESLQLKSKVYSFKDIEYIGEKFATMKLSKQIDPIKEKFQLIRSQEISSIKQSAKSSKLYHRDDTLVFTFDEDPSATKVCTIHLNDLSYDFQSFEKLSHQQKGFKNDNSFLLNNHLFQVAASRKKFLFTITDLTTKEVIKTYSFTKNDSITFKNSPIYVDRFIGYKKRDSSITRFKETSRFLKTINNPFLGITAQKINNSYQIVFGTTKNVLHGSTHFYSVPTVGYSISNNRSGTFNITPTYSYTSTPSIHHYNSYAYTETIYTKCLFDSNFNSIEGNAPITTIEAIKNLDVSYYNAVYQSLYTHNDVIHFSFFDSNTNSYKIYQFKK